MNQRPPGTDFHDDADRQRFLATLEACAKTGGSFMLVSDGTNFTWSKRTQPGRGHEMVSGHLYRTVQSPAMLSGICSADAIRRWCRERLSENGLRHVHPILRAAAHGELLSMFVWSSFLNT